MKILLIGLSAFLIMGCTKSPSYYKLDNALDNGNSLTGNIHEQGYYNCRNSGGSKGNCSKRHNYRE